MNMTDLQLIERLKKKDETALKEVMAMYKDQLYNYLHLMLGNKQRAEELTQDTFVTVYFKASSMRTEYLKTWIYKIAINHARNELRKKKIKRMFSISDIDESKLRTQSPSDSELALEQMMTLLPEKYRGPVIMRQVDELSFEEIAEILEKPTSTIKTLFYRGITHLRDRLAGQHPLPELKGGING
ncbi:MAG: RNA polymerase sigma factor [Candidatus Omnitrophota bacterium]